MTTTPIPADAVRQACTLEKANAIAVELKKAGEYYTYSQAPGIYGIYKRSYSTASDTSYLINLNGEKPTCTCPDFQNFGNYCKHTMALEIVLDEEAREEAQVAEYEASQKLAELFGCF
jgi:hypothetical protein